MNKETEDGGRSAPVWWRRAKPTRCTAPVQAGPLESRGSRYTPPALPIQVRSVGTRRAVSVSWQLPFSKDFLKFPFYLHLFTFGFLTRFRPIFFLLKILHHIFFLLLFLPLFYHFYLHKAYTWVYLHYACPCFPIIIGSVSTALNWFSL